MDRIVFGCALLFGFCGSEFNAQRTRSLLLSFSSETLAGAVQPYSVTNIAVNTLLSPFASEQVDVRYEPAFAQVRNHFPGSLDPLQYLVR